MKIKALTLVAAILLTSLSFGQSPQSFNYQAVIRNNAGTPVSNQNVGVRMRILQGTASGTPVYTETFAKTTTAQGLVNIEVGNGTSSDNFSAIDWSNGPYFLEVAADITGGSTYIVIGSSQLLSVPYALHSQSASSVLNESDGDSTNEIQDLQLNGENLTITRNSSATVIDLSKYMDDTRLTEQEVDSLVSNNGYASNLQGISESVYSGSWSGGVGDGDSAIIATLPTHTTWHFDVTVTAHDVNSNTNQRNVHREFIVYRSWNLAAVVQNLVTHYDVTTGAGIDVVFGTNSSNELFYKLTQANGGSTDIYYRVYVKMTKAN